MKRCVIIAGSPQFHPVPTGPDDFVIACDRGWNHAKASGMKVDLLLGDMDSIQGEPGPELPKIRMPREKDDTDTMAAIRHGLTLGYREFLLLGALGGRLDHTMANLQAAAFLSRQGARCILLDEETTAMLLTDGSIHLPRRQGYALSLFSFTETCLGVSASGVRYPLHNATLTNTMPVGVSNEWSGEEARISVEQGTLMILQSRIHG